VEVDLDTTLRLSGFKKGAFFGERYRIEALLGQGAMGKVFRATDTAEDRLVAVKVLHPELAKKDTVLERFRREAEILRGLGHRGIVRVLDAGQTSDAMEYLVMELLEGRNLKQRLQEDGPMSVDDLLPLLVQVCDALGAAHEQGVVHRDLKPENLFLIDDDAKVKVVDFGLGRMLTDKRMTKTGMMLGTPRYMAPEQIRSAKDADARTDQYALGIICHESLAGASPFPAGDPGQLLGCVMEGRILKLEDERPSVPPNVAAVIRRAMSKDPRDRFATIGAFVEVYAAALGRQTGRSMLAAQGMSDFFALADEPDASGEIEMPPEIQAPPTYEPPRFTRPPGMPAEAVAASPETPAPAVKKRRRPRTKLGWALFGIALVVVICLSASIAYGIRAWLRGDFGIATPAAFVHRP